MKHRLSLRSLVALFTVIGLLASLSGLLASKVGTTLAIALPSERNAIAQQTGNNSLRSYAVPTPFLYRPYYGSQTIGQRTTSFFDHDKPWYAYDGIFVRYDGKRWTSNDSIGTCTGGVNCYDGHNGYDLNLWYEPVLSAAAGTVIRAGWYDPTNHESAYGLWAAVDHGNGYVTAYGHLSALEVYYGEHVGIQWPLGTSGTTGSSTGPHLHFATYYLPQWYATDPFGWQGNYADPNIVPDYYLWVSNPQSSYAAPDVSDNGSAIYPGATMVDDGTADWSSTGSWSAARSSTDINGDLHYTATTSGSATASATWQPKLPASGYYEVAAYVDDNHASSSWAPYTIYSTDPNNPGSQVNHNVEVDESHIGVFQGPYGWENTGAQWISLGVYYFNTAQDDRVLLSNATGETGLQISADGMEFVPVSGIGSPAPTPTPTATQPPAPTPTATQTPSAYLETFGPVQSLTSVTPGATIKETVNIQNSGSLTWPAGGSKAVTLSYYWLDAQGHPLSTALAAQAGTASLPSNVAPGQTVGLSLLVHTPVLAGSYHLVIDMQQQGTWFGSQGATPLTMPVTVAPTLPKTYYFAEGYTGTGTTEYLSLTNPSTSAASVTITYYYQNGSPQARTYQVAAQGHTVLDINQEAGANQAVGMIVQSTQPLIAERTMYTHKGPFSAATDSIGSSFLNNTWYFAEGNTTSGWNTLLSVLNPNSKAVTLTVTYLLNGRALHGKAASFSVAARSRGTLVLNNDQPNQQFGMIVSASAPVLVERDEYLTSGTYRGGSASVGAPSPQATWYFGGGNTTSGFTEHLVLANPSSAAASVHISYLTTSGQVIAQTVSVPGYRRVEVNVNSALGSAQHSTMITSSRPIIAERQDFFTTSFNGTITGSSTVMGSNAPHASWYAADGNTAAGHADYLAIANPNSTVAQVQVVYYPTAGAPIIKTYTIVPNARLTVNIANDAGTNAQAGIAIYSTLPIVTEQVAFFNASGGNGGYTSGGLGI